MGLAVLIITVSTMVSLVLHVVVIHSGDVFPVCLYSDMCDCERSVSLNQCWIDSCQRYAPLIWVWFGRSGNFLEIDIFRIVDKLLPVIIILVRATVGMAGSCATASEQIVLAIWVQEVPR